MDIHGNTKYKMFSLFSGSGGFELASSLCGIEPVGCSEIEPFPIKVTKKRFPRMKHYGDISKIDVNELETVDLITGGSPCQDMSVAGKRQGMSKQCPKCDYKVVGNEEITECPKCGAELEYTRSGLFMEQIRIVKEMRRKDELEQLRSGRTVEHIRPRFMLWENVTGAFSSNDGEDFRAVLEETAKIKDSTATIPRPPKGKWNNSGLIVGNGYSIAWRVLDAQYWGVPQRRRRIALVADFGGECAGEILFKRDGLQRNFTESRKAWQGIAGYSSKSTGETGGNCIAFEPGAASRVGNHTYEEQCGALRANMGDNQFAVAIEETTDKFSAGFCPEQSEKTRGIGYEEGKSPTLRAGIVPATIKKETIVMNTRQFCNTSVEKADTLLATDYKEPQAKFLPVQKNLYCMATQQGGAEIMNDLAPTITAAAGMSGNNQPVINQPVQKQKNLYCMASCRQNAEIVEDKCPTLLASTGGNNQPIINQERKGIVNLNKHDVQSKAILDPEGIAPSLYAGECRGGGGECYILDKQPVIPIQDQAISNGSGNGLGIGNADEPMYTLMADTRHGIAYSLQGNMIGREDHNGPQGSGVNEEVSFTLKATDRHAVVYGIDRAGFNQGENAKYDFSVLDDQSQTLIARGPNGVCHENKSFRMEAFGQYSESQEASTIKSRDYKDATDLIVELEYIVRRLTPLECSRLQGFPDWWTDGLEIENPNGYDIAFWREVFETHRQIVTGASKPKTDKWIIKWLREEPNDGAKYKMWGNGISLPCFLYVIEGIKEVLDREENLR